MKIDFVKSSRVFLLILLFVLPFVYWPWTELTYEVPRVIFFSLAVEILGVLAIFSLSSLKREELDYKLIFLIGLFIGLSFLSSFLGIDLRKSLIGNFYRRDGLITLCHLGGITLFISLFYNRYLENALPLLLTLSTGLLSFWALIQSLLLWPFPAYTSFGNPNFLGGFILVNLPFNLYLYQHSPQKNRRRFFFALLLLQIIAVLLTRSRGAILGAFLLLVLWFFSIGKIKLKTRHFFAVSLTIIFILLGSALIFLSNYRNSAAQFNAESRERIFRKGLEGFRQRPLLGWGYANFDYAFEAGTWPIFLEKDVYVDKGHSLLFEVLVTGGIFGFIIYALIISRAFLNLLKQKGLLSRYYLLVLIIFIFHAQTNVISLAEEVLFWIILGLAARQES